MVCHIHAPNEYTIQPTTYVGHIRVVIYKNETSICPSHLTEVASGLGQDQTRSSGNACRQWCARLLHLL